MTTYFDDQKTDLSDCYVIFENERKDIQIYYREDDYIVQYAGPEALPGHYELTCIKGAEGKASLHEVPISIATNNILMVGMWKEGGRKGTWLIDLIK